MISDSTSLQAVEGEVPGVAVLLGDAVEPAGQHGQLGGHRRPQDQLLAVVDHVLVSGLGSSVKRSAMAFSCVAGRAVRPAPPEIRLRNS